MTEKLYDIDSFLSEFEATVLDSFPMDDGFLTVLDKTAFFPEGGGQPSDIGYLDNARVYDVQIKDDIIYHHTSKNFTKGERVKGKIDFERRFSFMQNHSGEHIVSGIVNKLFGFDNVGFHLSEENCTLDFNGILTREDLDKIELLSNEKIWQNVKFKSYYPTDEELKNLNYRSKKEIDGMVRIVEIEDTDYCACCAPHVKEAAQIGVIKLLDFEKLRGGVRINFKCGKAALLDYQEKYKNIYDISGLLSAKQNEVNLSVENLLKKIQNDKQILKKQIEKTTEIILNNANAEVKLYFLDGFEMKELQFLADTLHKKLGGLRAVFSKTADGYLFSICDESDLLDDFFVRFKENFSLKGGGRNGMVQGTVYDSQENLRKFF